MPIWTWAAHHRGWSVGLGLLGLLVIVAAVVYLTVLRSPGTPLNIRQALRLYRARQHVEARLRRGLPPPGVYDYDTSGSEGLDIPGEARGFPSRTPLIVTGAGRCASLRWEPLLEHVEELRECSTGKGSLTLVSTDTVETLAGFTTRSTMTCPVGTYLRPPRIAVGLAWSTTCHMGTAPVGARGTVLGRTQVVVDGRAIPAWHTRLTLSFTGAQSGTNPTDYWFSTSGNLLVREMETAHVAQKAGPLGSVQYDESMAITLRSTKPQT